MERKLIASKEFKRDCIQLVQKGVEFYLLKAWEEVIHCLRTGEKMTPARKNHPLKHDKKGLWDCHICDDLVLLYSFDKEKVELIRLGTHRDIGLTK